MRITTSLLTMDEVKELYPNKNFFCFTNFCFDCSCNMMLLAYSGNRIVGWISFKLYKRNNKFYVSNTGTWVAPKYRKQSVGKKLNIQLIRKLDKEVGRGNYTFKSVICSIGGAKIWNHRISLTSNPLEHIYADDNEPYENKRNGLPLFKYRGPCDISAYKRNLSTLYSW